MMITNAISKVVAILSILAISGCASVNRAPANVDAESKQFKPNAAVSQVYVFRNENFGGAISMPVTVNGKLAGNSGPKSFFKFDLPAGDHRFTSQGTESQITIKTEVGKIYYIWQEVKMGAFVAGSRLQPVSEEVGKAGVLESVQIQAEF